MKDKKEVKGSVLTEEKKIAFTAIEQQMDEVHRVGEDIWRFSETGGNEHKSHDLICAFLKRKGFTVEQHYLDFPTAFRAQFGMAEIGGAEHPNIGLICQYDAEESTGHSKGNNLSTAVSLAAALGLQTVIKFATEPLGMLTVIGCPGTRDNTGKIIMHEAGGFKGIDFILAAYPLDYTNYKPQFVGAQTQKITFRGRQRRDGDRPWEVANPVNAAVLAYQNVAAARQQFKSDWIVKGVIPNGGSRADLMPDHTSMEFLLKAPTPVEMAVLWDTLHRCFEAAATTSGCKFEIESTVKEFLCNLVCERLSELYVSNATLSGYTFHNKVEGLMSQDDISNVSTSIPTLKVFYYSGSEAGLGTDEFARYAGSKDSNFMSTVQGKILAMVGIDLITSEENMKEVFEQHQTELTNNYEAAGQLSITQPTVPETKSKQETPET